VDLTAVSPEEAAQEIRDSKVALEAALDTEVRHFCYPYGRYNPEHREIVRAAGYTSATTTHRGRVHAAHDAFALNRIMVARACNPIQFAAKILSGYEDRRG
jgi:peptidoglycan/xylan/chitin deacetylase (PgdA/CDA1 family)